MVVDHDCGLKNRCSPSRFREIAIDNLSLDGGSIRSGARERAAVLRPQRRGGGESRGGAAARAWQSGQVAATSTAKASLVDPTFEPSDQGDAVQRRCRTAKNAFFWRLARACAANCRQLHRSSPWKAARVTARSLRRSPPRPTRIGSRGSLHPSSAPAFRALWCCRRSRSSCVDGAGCVEER